MKLGKNTDKYLLGLLESGPTGLLRASVDLKDKRKAHKRKKELKATPRTTNINTSPGVTHVSVSGASRGARNLDSFDEYDSEDAAGSRW